MHIALHACQPCRCTESHHAIDTPRHSTAVNLEGGESIHGRKRKEWCLVPPNKALQMHPVRLRSQPYWDPLVTMKKIESRGEISGKGGGGAQ